MQTAWDIVSPLASKETLYQLMCRLQCRCILWATGKGKLGCEKKDYEGGLDEIKGVFVIETTQALRQPIAHPWFQGSQPQPAASGSGAVVAATSAFVAPDELNSIIWMAFRWSRNSRAKE